MSGEVGPPRLAEAVMRRLLPPAEREYALGDLAEEHRRRATTGRRWVASMWYWSQVVRSVGPLITFDTGSGEAEMFSGLGRDLRSALRQFRTHPLFAGVVVATVGLGVGGATAVFSVLDGVVLRPLDFPDSERVVTLWGRSSEYPRTPLTVGDHNDVAAHTSAFDAIGAEWGNSDLILGEGNAEQVSVGWVTPSYFDVVRVQPALGRLLDAGDVNTVVLGHDLWVRRYGSDPSVVGRLIDLGGTSLEVVGVLGPGVDPNLTTFSGNRAINELWRPFPADWMRGDDRSVGWLRSSARLKEGVSLEAAQQEVDAIMTRVNATVTDRDGGEDMMVHLRSARTDLVAPIASTLWILLAAVLGVLLIASTNVANLMLGRGQSRTGEVAVRAALGGSRGRLFRQFFVEGLVLAAVGGLLGVALGWAGMKALVAWAPPSLPRMESVALDFRVLVFALSATSLAAVLFGLLPALKGSRSDVAETLGRRTSTASRGDRRLTRALVVAEIALSLGLLVGTGLLLRSLQGLHRAELGFEKEGLLTFALQTASVAETAEEEAQALQAYMASVAETPGVVSVGVTNRVPLAGGLLTGAFRSQEMVAAEAEPLNGSYRYVTPDYFETMGARLAAGRSFRTEDALESTVIDEQIAERLWPGQNPVGRLIEYTSVGADPALAEVVGVVQPMKHAGVADAAPPTVFLPMLAVAHQQNFRYVVARVTGDPAALVEPIRVALRRVDGDAVMARERTMADLYDTSVASTRFAGRMLSVFAGVALLLATIGLHGVMALAVRQRSREFGIRVAVGAAHRTILRDVLGSGVRLVALGTALGILLSVVVGRYLGSLLYGIAPTDLASITAATLVIVAVGFMGSWLPARRVLRVDPVKTLRTE